jgi:glycosyltransferase involved in cell wall biosynthesis
VLSHLYPAPGHERHLFVHEQVCALHELGVDISVLSPTAMTFGLGRVHPRLRRRQATPQRAVRDGIIVDYARVPVLPRRLLFDRSGDLYYAGLRRHLPALRAAGIELIHAHQAMPDGAAAQRLAAALDVPFVVTVHGADVYQHLRAGGRVAARTRTVLAAAAAVVGVSSKVAASLQDFVPSERLFVNLNGVVGSATPVAPADVLPERRLLLTVAYLIERKGHTVVLEALRLLHERAVAPGATACAALAWAVVGDGPLRADLERRAAQLGLADAVHFLGRRPHDEVLALMARAELFVLPSWDEAFGLVYTEAMAQQTPVVACRGEGVEDFVIHGESGYLVPPRDPEALAAVIDAALADEGVRRRVGAAGRNAAAQLTWERNAREQLRIYRRVLGETNGLSDAPAGKARARTTDPPQSAPGQETNKEPM